MAKIIGTYLSDECSRDSNNVTTLYKYWYLTPENGEGRETIMGVLNTVGLPKKLDLLSENLTYYHTGEVTFERDLPTVGILEGSAEETDKNFESGWTLRFTYTNGGTLYVSTQDYQNKTPDTKPWDLRIQNYNITYPTKQIAFETSWEYNEDTSTWMKTKLVKNSADDMFNATTEHTYTKISWTYYTQNAPNFTSLTTVEPVINSKLVKLAGVEYLPYTVKLFYPIVTPMQKYDDKGELDYTYYKIDINYEVDDYFSRQFLDVGTRAKFTSLLKGSNLSREIYRTTLIEYPMVELPEPEYLCREQVVQKLAEVNVWKAKNTDTNKDRELSYELVTDPLPLKADGSLFTEAMALPEDNPYLSKDFFEYKPVDLTLLNLPKEH